MSDTASGEKTRSRTLTDGAGAPRELGLTIFLSLVLSLGVILVLTLLVITGVRAETVLAVGHGEMIRLSRPAGTVFVADPDIADVQVASPGALFVLGKKAGQTTVFALGDDDQPIVRETIRVQHDVDLLRKALRARFPTIRLDLESAPGSLMVAGDVDAPEEVEAIAATLRPFLGKEEVLLNRLSVQSPSQVHLRVRVTEVSREVTQMLGINWGAISKPGNFIGGIISGRDFMNSAGQYVLSDRGAYSVLGGFATKHLSIQGMLDVLDQEGLISVLAEPNLTAISGETASFLAGGEFPIPISKDDGEIQIEFKQFGVALDFTPTVLAPDRISLKVRPEISELSETASININGLRIPGLSVRRVETTVELASGQSFAIGGLLQNNIRDTMSQVPGLGSIPVLGKLFSSSNYVNNKTELVVIVTPYVVRPVSGGTLRTPLNTLRPASDVEYILQRQAGVDPLAGTAPRLLGPAGFVY